MSRGRYARMAMRETAEDLLVAFAARETAPAGSQLARIAEQRFETLCRAGAHAGLAPSAAELELLVADVDEQLPPMSDKLRSRFDLTWMMQARFILARRLSRTPSGPRAVA